MLEQFKNIFKAGSKTYYYSSLFFPPHIKDDVTILYAFVRTADDFVDQIPQNKAGFEDFEAETLKAMSGEIKTENIIISSFLDLAKEKEFKHEWIIAFLKAMKADIYKSKYNTFSELETYMYGSAEVVGLMMCQIMNISKDAYPAAQKLGKAMQLINFIRDIQEDINLGRQYIPQTDLDMFGIKTLLPKNAEEKAQFKKLVTFQTERYFEMLKEAEEGFHFIPRQYQIPIRTASDMYKWTAKKILKDPFIVFDHKVKPSLPKILLALFIHSHNSCPFLNTQKHSMFHLPTIS